MVAKVTGIPWFNRMEVGINQAAKKLEVNTCQASPSIPTPAARVKVIEDLNAKKVNTIILVQNNAKVLEPVLEKCATKAS